MKSLTFIVAFVATACIVIIGTLVYPSIIGPAVAHNNEYVFGFFLATFMSLLVFTWIREKIARKIRKQGRK
jgi:hypothetical protein